VVGGINGDTADAEVKVVRTETGYAVEVAVPLKNDIWDITPTHEGVLGFQVHLNAAVASPDRDTKLIWSIFDTADLSSQDPSLFGKLIFFKVGTMFEASPTEVPSPTPNVANKDEITWDSREWKLLWSDEFAGEAGTPVNSEYWNHDIGGSGWGNLELEYYTNSTDNAALDGNGNLVITARQAEPNNKLRCHYGTCQYTSARLTTKDKVEFTYGRVEARIKIPRGQGIWPAFWMLGADIDTNPWPASGEIDIMENVGFEPKTVHGTIHGPGYSGASGRGFPYRMKEDVADDFHVFAIDWDKDAIRWYIDGVLAKTTVSTSVEPHKWVYDHDFFILLNVAVGGRWPGIPNAETVFPQEMLVDYVRVYQLVE
jgi:beta-glucanase (GH16 family)